MLREFRKIDKDLLSLQESIGELVRIFEFILNENSVADCCVGEKAVLGEVVDSTIKEETLKKNKKNKKKTRRKNV